MTCKQSKVEATWFHMRVIIIWFYQADRHDNVPDEGQCGENGFGAAGRGLYEDRRNVFHVVGPATDDKYGKQLQDVQHHHPPATANRVVEEIDDELPKLERENAIENDLFHKLSHFEFYLTSVAMGNEKTRPSRQLMKVSDDSKWRK